VRVMVMVMVSGDGDGDLRVNLQRMRRLPIEYHLANVRGMTMK